MIELTVEQGTKKGTEEESESADGEGLMQEAGGGQLGGEEDQERCP